MPSPAPHAMLWCAALLACVAHAACQQRLTPMASVLFDEAVNDIAGDRHMGYAALNGLGGKNYSLAVVDFSQVPPEVRGALRFGVGARRVAHGMLPDGRAFVAAAALHAGVKVVDVTTGFPRLLFTHAPPGARVTGVCIVNSHVYAVDPKLGIHAIQLGGGSAQDSFPTSVISLPEFHPLDVETDGSSLFVSGNTPAGDPAMMVFAMPTPLAPVVVTAVQLPYGISGHTVKLDTGVVYSAVPSKPGVMAVHQPGVHGLAYHGLAQLHRSVPMVDVMWSDLHLYVVWEKATGVDVVAEWWGSNGTFHSVASFDCSPHQITRVYAKGGVVYAASKEQNGMHATIIADYL